MDRESLDIEYEALSVVFSIFQFGISTKGLFHPFNHIILEGPRQVNEVGAVTCNPDDQIGVFLRVSLGIQNVATRNLGNVTAGYLSTLASGKSNNLVDGDLATAQKVINSAIDKVSSLRGRIGAFQKNVVGATIRSLGVALENTSAVESARAATSLH